MNWKGETFYSEEVDDKGNIVMRDGKPVSRALSDLYRFDRTPPPPDHDDTAWKRRDEERQKLIDAIEQEHARTGRLTRGVFFWGRFSGGYDVSTLFENPQGGTPCSLCGALITDENFDEDEVHFLPAHRGSEWAHKRCIDAAGGA